MPNKLSQFWQELKRRRVIHVIVVYATAAFVIIELVNNVYETLNLPDWTPALILIILVVGFPIAVIFAWIYDFTVKGIKKTEPIEDTAEVIELHSTKDKPVIPEKSIIVLPFENISSDPDQEYFSDGLTEEIITDLSHIHDFLVISRSSAMTFKGSKKKIREIANEVNVKYVLEGSVRKSGNNLRITGQLIDAASDTHIWVKKYSGTLEDIFDIQEKVSSSIANELKIKISSEEKKKIQERPIDNVFAYDCYLRAYREIMSFTKERVELGLELLQKGNEFAPENAIIYAGMAFAYFQYANLGYEQEKHVKKAEEYTKKALVIDPELAEAHAVHANILLIFNGNIREAINHYNIAIRNKPDNPEIMEWLFWCYHLVGKTEAAITIGEKYTKIDPINPLNDTMEGLNHFMTGRFKLALEPIFAVYRLFPEVSMWQLWKSLVLMYNDRPAETSEFISETVKETEKDSFSSLLIFLKYALLGDKKKLSSLLTPDFLEAMQIDCQLSWHLATFYAHINEKDHALEWLENAVNRGFINYPFLSDHDKLLNSIRDEKRFKILLQRVKKEWENFKV